MNDFTLYCLGAGGQKGEWDFRPARNGMNVVDPGGKVVYRFAHTEAHDLFVLPSFWRSVKNLGFKAPGGTTVWFAPDRRDVTAVKEYLDVALAFPGAEAVGRFAKRGALHVLGGLGLLVLGLLLFAAIDYLLGRQHRYAFLLPVGMILVGIGEIAWGCSALLRAGRVKRLLRRDGAG